MRLDRLLLTAATLAIGFACPLARATTQDEVLLKQQLQRLADRLDRLEKRNAELEAQLKAYVERPGSKDGGVENRIQALEKYNKRAREKLARFVVGSRVLVEERERVHLAEVDRQFFA